MTVWSFPNRIVFDPGAVAMLGDEARRLGGRHALIVTDPGVAGAGLAARVADRLTESGVTSTIFDRVAPNPSEMDVVEATRAYTSSGADLVVGLGGGSSIDVAKLVRMAATHPSPLAQYDEAQGGEQRIVNRLPPMIAIPTTAGTGSEVGRSAVATLEETGRKTVFFAAALLPDVAILDPELTVSLPAPITAATGFDALTHGVEAYCALGDHPMADAIALAGVALVAAHLERAVEDGNDLEARGAMLKASAMGAVAFQKGLGACHSLAHPLSSHAGLHHGLANSLCLPAVLEFNRVAIPDRIDRIGRVLRRDESSPPRRASDLVRSLRAAVGLPEGLAAVGVHEETLPGLADVAFEDGCHQLNPRACTREDLLDLYRQSLGNTARRG